MAAKPRAVRAASEKPEAGTAAAATAPEAAAVAIPPAAEGGETPGAVAAAPGVAPLPSGLAVAADAPSAEGPTPEPAGVVLRVRALQPSRWRIGRQFGTEPVEIAASDLTEDQIMALMLDTALAVDVIAPE